jgi:hypothetical protein
MQTELFENKPKLNIIRTMGFYQPFCSLMLHGKIETRWVIKGKKPPFPLGKYVFYSTQKVCDLNTLLDWCGSEIVRNISHTLLNDKTRTLTESAIAIGELVEVRPLTLEDEPLSFVKFIGNKTELKEGKEIHKVQWALIFKDVRPCTPFKWKHGKQGVGFLPSELYQNFDKLI